MKGKHATAIVVVLVIVVIGAVAWKKDKLNKWLPEKLRHKTSNKNGFIGLIRSGQYTMGPGGEQGIPGVDLNTSDWV